MIIDFTKGSMGYRLSHCQGRNELIVKAVGWKKDQPLHIYDTTAGLGRESFLLAQVGCQITLFERHPEIGVLLEQNLARSALDPTLSPIIQRMTLYKQCAIDFLENFIEIAPDVIYCDPMFPLRSKSALVKKEMQFLHAMVSPDSDSEKLVALACKIAKKRVVVKRPHLAPALKENPAFVLKARAHRFDIYLKT